MKHKLKDEKVTDNINQSLLPTNIGARSYFKRIQKYVSNENEVFIVERNRYYINKEIINKYNSFIKICSQGILEDKKNKYYWWTKDIYYNSYL